MTDDEQEKQRKSAAVEFATILGWSVNQYDNQDTEVELSKNAPNLYTMLQHQCTEPGCKMCEAKDLLLRAKKELVEGLKTGKMPIGGALDEAEQRLKEAMSKVKT